MQANQIQILNTYTFLTKSQKKVLKYLQSLSRQYTYVFPSKATIADAVDCCKDTVTVAINRLKEINWLISAKRGYQSNVYFMDNEIIETDFDKLKKSVSNPSVLYDSYCTSNISYANTQEKPYKTYEYEKTSKIKEKEQNLDDKVNTNLNTLGLSHGYQSKDLYPGQRYIFAKASQAELITAKERMQWAHQQAKKTGINIKNWIAYATITLKDVISCGKYGKLSL